MGEPSGGTAPIEAAAPRDGRTARAERSRRQVVEALLDLLDEGEVEPTAREVADRAQVSLRTVFHHFQSMESVYAECFSLQHERHWAHLQAPAGDGPLAARIEATVALRAQLFDDIAAPRRAGIFWAERSPALARGLAGARRVVRQHLEQTFARELDAVDDRDHLLDALDAAASFEAWDLLRHGLGRSRADAAAALSLTLHAHLDPIQEDR